MPGNGDVALLYGADNGTEGVAFWALGETAGTPYRSVNQVVHFTHYTVGHAHLGAYAFVSMVLFGAIPFRPGQIARTRRIRLIGARPAIR